MLDPVERLATRQGVKHAAGPLSDETLHVREVTGRHDRARHFPLVVVLRRIHADEAEALHVPRLVFDLDTADLVGINLMVYLNTHHVFVFRNRPVRAVEAVATIMDRRLTA